jgi:DNA replication protein DnaC
VGKSFVASALAQKACRDGYSVLYVRAQSLFRDLTPTFAVDTDFGVNSGVRPG